MSYVQKILSNEEKLISISRLHWIYPVEGLLFFMLFLSLGIVADHYLKFYSGESSIAMHIDLKWIQIERVPNPFKWLFGFAGFAIFWPLFLIYISSEIGLTDKRIIHKKGLMFIEVQELDLEDIRAENIIHGWFGWLWGYGRVHFDCRFVENHYIPAIKDPYRMVKALHVARMKPSDFDYEEMQHDLKIAAIKRRKKSQGNDGNVLSASFRGKN